MIHVERLKENPFIHPNKDEEWDAHAAFNPCVIKEGKKYHLLYRAQSCPQGVNGDRMSLSTIGYAESDDGVHFSNRRQIIKPENKWEKYGCEDPRITKLEDKYYIFYTALSTYPFSEHGIKLGLAITKDFKKIEAKHPVTPFNSKAMALFSEKINGKYVAVLTANTDKPPAKIALAFFDKEEDIWSEDYWQNWYSSLDEHVIPLLRSSKDHIEVGAPPVKTKDGWLLVYSYIQNYFSGEKVFGIESVLLDLEYPSKIVGRTPQPMLVPEKEYEKKGDVKNVIFPSGALLEDKKLRIYYGATDTTCCAATADIDEIINTSISREKPAFVAKEHEMLRFKRYSGNPTISPRPEFSWEAHGVFNPAAIYEGGKVHNLYRAMSEDDTSTFGYACSKDGASIDERLSYPVYEPREEFEIKTKPGNSGCEDPRLTRIGDRIYVFYTAFNGHMPRVAFSSISVEDFLNKKWNWAKPLVITPPEVDDKDACIMPRKIKDKYVIFHRVHGCIRINFVEDLDFEGDRWLEDMGYMIRPRKEYWDNRKFGIASPPMETEKGWLLLFHRVTAPQSIYKVEALMLDLEDPTKVIAETDATLFEPEEDYEKYGVVDNVVFPCGSLILDGEVYIYYGGADTVVGVAKMALNDIYKRMGI